MKNSARLSIFHFPILLLSWRIKTSQSFQIPIKGRGSITAKFRDETLGFGSDSSLAARHGHRTKTGLFSQKESHSSPEENSGKVDKNLPKILLDDNEVSTKGHAQNDDCSKELSDAPKRIGMDLFWCGREECRTEELREKVIGDHNLILFDHPATGQVAYSYRAEKATANGAKVYTPRVLILVKRNDDELLKVAADAVRELTSKGDISIMLPPDVAAKFKHYYAVDNDNLQLFDPKPIPGFGGNHLPSDNFQYNPEVDSYDSDEEDCPDDDEDRPDLVCTLGGDGLLMHASNLFPGPCPPILCIAGGSLGFLTPFSRCEMVDAIRISLGLGQDKVNGNAKAWLEYDSPRLPPQGQTFAGSKAGKKGTIKRPNVLKFGANSQICLSMRMRLECQVINREGVVRARFNVLNEVVIDRGSSPYLAALECFCDDVHLTTVQADGVIFSTPTGSTAYSMAAGGSVVHPAVPAILVTPICPHVLSFRSMVFPDHVILRCYVPEDARADASVAFDGKHRRELHRGDSVQVQMSPYPVPTINRSDHSSDWLTSLKRNFNFNTRARQSPL